MAGRATAGRPASALDFGGFAGTRLGAGELGLTGTRLGAGEVSAGELGAGEVSAGEPAGGEVGVGEPLGAGELAEITGGLVVGEPAAEAVAGSDAQSPTVSPRTVPTTELAVRNRMYIPPLATPELSSGRTIDQLAT